SSKKVAFSAGTTGHGVIASGSTLVFPVDINYVGGGYNPGTGIFTAPTVGQYVFYVSAQVYSNDTLYVSIVHNGGAKVMTMSDGGRGKDFYDSGSNLVTLNLQQEDRVWARCQSGSNHYSEGIPITTFSGFLV
ncbi:hibernation-associated plasma protein HP-27-like, partial [Saccostrea cucullata]|uniref:hibernation-associated plasma protein HP-27-like n=1 Tax=Saccostrea cuccullata TaxID=36930 RepID=UPI002ED2A84C